jgi:hypothetical protein
MKKYRKTSREMNISDWSYKERTTTAITQDDSS